jgi:carbamoyl-phosphate synthase small subunit
LLRVQISNHDSIPLKLLLSDGESFEGLSIGERFSPVAGEVVFNTGMVGYTEALTDPSYAGQILCFTYPLIGNYGVPDYLRDDNGLIQNFESPRIQVKAVIADEVSEEPSHFESKRRFGEWLDEEGISGIRGLDTRELTIHLRLKGVMMGAIARTNEEAQSALKTAPDYSTFNFYESVSTKSVTRFGRNRRGKIALLDCGVKLNIVRSLVQRGFEVSCFPYNAKFEDIMADGFDGIAISNGPGDPKTCTPAIELARLAVDNSVPLLGICLGTQIVALSQGAETFKLKYGHRGQNKPCVDLIRNRCMVTSQNHGYSVLKESLENTQLKPWFINADDKTIEGVVHSAKPCLAVQFHPEGSPGPLDPSYVFDVFAEKIIRKE